MPSQKQTDNKPDAKLQISEESEMERLRRDVFRPDMEKLQLFTKMLRANALYKKAKVSHK